MSTETNALRAVENDVPEKQITQCRKIIVAVEKGEVNLSARLFEALRKMLRAIEKSKQASADEKLDAITLLVRSKKANRTADQDDDTPAVATGVVVADSEHRSIDDHDCMRAQTAILGHNWGNRLPLSRYDKEALLSELLGEVTVPVVQQLIVTMRRPNPQGFRLSSYREIFGAAQWYLEDHGASELPREPAELDDERWNNFSFEERMRERGAEGY